MMNSRKSRRGFTLLELTVYSALLGFVLLAVYGVFIASMRYWQVTQASTDLQSSAQKTVAHIVSELSEATLQGMRIDTAPNGIIFLSPRDTAGRFQTNAVGQVIWQRWVCYYYDSGSKKIIRKTQNITPSVVPPLNNNTTATFQNLAGGETIASNVTAFTISGTSTISISASYETTVFSNAARTSDSQVQIVDMMATRNN